MKEEPGPVGGHGEQGCRARGRSGEPWLCQRPASQRGSGRGGAAEKKDQGAQSRQRIERECSRQVQTRERQCRVRGSARGTGQPRQLAEEAVWQERRQRRGEMSENGRGQSDRAPDQTEPAVSGQSGRS